MTTDSAKLYGTPVSVCKFEVGPVTNEDPSAKPAQLSVTLTGSLEKLLTDLSTGRVKHAKQALRVAAASGTASLSPYKVRVTAYFEDVDRNCVPPASAEALKLRLAGWRETISFDITIFVGDQAFPVAEPASVELFGVKGNLGKLKITSNAVVNFDPTLSYEVRLKSGYAKFLAEASPIIEQTITIVADASETIDARAPLIKERKFYKLFIAPGGIPVVISGSFSLELRVAGEVTGKLSATETVRIGFDRLSYGVECTRVNDCIAIEQRTPVTELKVGGEGNASANLRVSLLPTLTISAYEAVTGRVTLEPYVQADAGIEGHVQFLAGIDPEVQLPGLAFDADYRLTTASLKAGVDAYLYADFRTFGYTWLVWPSGATMDDLSSHETLKLAQSTIAGLPTLSATVDMTALHPTNLAAIRIDARAANVANDWVAMFPSMRTPLIPWQRWTTPKIMGPLGVPAGSYGFVQNDAAPEGEYWLSFTAPGTYEVRLGGFSSWGTWARQYVQVQVTVTDTNGNGILDHVEARTPAQGISVSTATCSTPVASLPMTCMLVGTALPADIRFNASNCSPDPMTPVTGGSATQRQFTCTPVNAGTAVNVSYVVPGLVAVPPAIPPATADFLPSPLLDVFVWPVDPTNPSKGHVGTCGDSTLGCFWLSDADRTSSVVWRDAQPFQWEASSTGKWHLGADYNLDSDAGKDVHAASAGTVVNVVSDACTWGNAVFLRHQTSAGPVTTMYAHVDWVNGVAPVLNTVVERGALIAKVGNGAWTARAECTAGSWPYHLHFELRRGTDATMGTGSTTEKLTAGTNGPQGQIDPNVYIAAGVPGIAAPLNDTGITASQCFQAGSNVLVSCASAAALALNDQQDGMVGRDVTNNDDSDGKAGFSFSLVAKSTGGHYDRTECIRDNVTGQIWEGKTADGGIRDGTRTYTNWGDGRAGDASAYVAQVNATALCGYTDWRLPKVRELQAIVDYGVPIPGPTIDMAWFPNAQYAYWSSSPYAGNADGAWYVNFYGGSVGNSSRGNYFHVRLVR